MATSLDDLTTLARALVQAELNVMEAELELKRATEYARLLREETIPNLCMELGISEMTLTDGSQLKIEQAVYCSLPKDRKEEAFAWLTEHKHDGIIKTTLTVEYGKGEMKKAVKFAQSLMKKGLHVDVEQKVHPSTLKAFVKERIEEGTAMPLDAFGARPVWTTKLIMAKKG